MEGDGSSSTPRWRQMKVVLPRKWVEVDLLPWKLPSASMEASICFHLVAPTSMEVGGSFHPWELVEASMEVDGNFHGRTLKNQIM